MEITPFVLPNAKGVTPANIEDALTSAVELSVAVSFEDILGTVNEEAASTETLHEGIQAEHAALMSPVVEEGHRMMEEGGSLALNVPELSKEASLSGVQAKEVVETENIKGTSGPTGSMGPVTAVSSIEEGMDSNNITQGDAIREADDTERAMAGGAGHGKDPGVGEGRPLTATTAETPPHTAIQTPLEGLPIVAPAEAMAANPLIINQDTEVRTKSVNVETPAVDPDVRNPVIASNGPREASGESAQGRISRNLETNGHGSVPGPEAKTHKEDKAGHPEDTYAMDECPKDMNACGTGDDGASFEPVDAAPGNALEAASKGSEAMEAVQTAAGEGGVVAGTDIPEEGDGVSDEGVRGQGEKAVDRGRGVLHEATNSKIENGMRPAPDGLASDAGFTGESVTTEAGPDGPSTDRTDRGENNGGQDNTDRGLHGEAVEAERSDSGIIKPIALQQDGGAKAPLQLQKAHGARETDQFHRIQAFERIEEGVRLAISSGGKEIRVRLEPESLGRVDIRLRENGGAVAVRIFVENEGVKGMIESERAKISEMFANHGVALKDCVVETRPAGGSFPGFEDPHSMDSGAGWAGGAGGGSGNGSFRGFHSAVFEGGGGGGGAGGGGGRGFDGSQGDGRERTPRDYSMSPYGAALKGKPDGIDIFI